ncbi:MAG: radical SAM protein [Treponemataceae bacterium]|nr:radical SAM protein [Treponemataceae bacterium]
MILLVQPPFVQLNTPYPSLYYLRSFLQNKGEEVLIQDHSIELFLKIFSAPGLAKIFEDARPILEQRNTIKTPLLKDASTFSTALLFLSQKEQWIKVIDDLIAFLQGHKTEFAHRLTLANGTLPWGPRTAAFITEREGTVLPDEAKQLASRMLADVADFIHIVLDPSFSLVKYGAQLAASIRSFQEVETGLSGYILQTFYEPFLQQRWSSLTKPELLGLTIPFPGCLLGTLCCARSAKSYFGDDFPVVAGGGYVNTELRHIQATRFFAYIDFLCFDRGYGAFTEVISQFRQKQKEKKETSSPILYKTIYFDKKEGILSGLAEEEYSFPSKPQGTGNTRTPENTSFFVSHLEKRATSFCFPDYTEVDFSRYITPVDDTNPMHRLWTEGKWLKAYLAHGCYWHACGFCDVHLDYIRDYQAVDIEAFFQHFLDQAQKTNIRGIHLVDEAAPVSALIRLAELNLAAGSPLFFWGNIRFEKEFTRDVVALLAAGGLVGVSGGIEVATESGFKRMGKGISLKEVVAACAAFKESGILTHAYLIYGYWDQDPQDIIDSAELLRQLFAAGLLDSAFWHKFVLTRHSRFYREKCRGRHPTLVIRESVSPPDYFADNDIPFQGEERFDAYTIPLDTMLHDWMQGKTDIPVSRYFPFKVPRSQVPPDRISQLLEEYLTKEETKNCWPPTTPSSPQENEALRSLSIDSLAKKQHLPMVSQFSQTQAEPANSHLHTALVFNHAQGTMEWSLFLGSEPLLYPPSSTSPQELRWWYRYHSYQVRLSTKDLQENPGTQKALPLVRLHTILCQARIPRTVSKIELLQHVASFVEPSDVPHIYRTLREGGLIFYQVSQKIPESISEET